MGRYAIIKGDIVDGVAIADAPLDTDGIWIDVTDVVPQPGRDWTYKDGIFSPDTSNKVPAPPETWVISKAAMIARFTNAEYVGILTAKKTDVTVEAWYDVFQSSSWVDLKDQNCIDGINFLVSKNLLTQARADEILTTPAKQN